MREAVYAVLMGGLGWFAWHGAAALVIAALLVLEILITAVDEAVENRTRVLPQNERVLHVLLTLNLGIVIALLVPQLLESVLDFFAWRKLGAAGAAPLIDRPLARSLPN